MALCLEERRCGVSVFLSLIILSYPILSYPIQLGFTVEGVSFLAACRMPLERLIGCGCGLGWSPTEPSMMEGPTTGGLEISPHPLSSRGI